MDLSRTGRIAAGTVVAGGIAAIGTSAFRDHERVPMDVSSASSPGGAPADARLAAAPRATSTALATGKDIFGSYDADRSGSVAENELYKRSYLGQVRGEREYEYLGNGTYFWTQPIGQQVATSDAYVGWQAADQQVGNGDGRATWREFGALIEFSNVDGRPGISSAERADFLRDFGPTRSVATEWTHWDSGYVQTGGTSPGDDWDPGGGTSPGDDWDPGGTSPGDDGWPGGSGGISNGDDYGW